MVELNRNRRVARFVVAASVLAILAACAVGPDYRPPHPPVPSGFTTDAARIARGAQGAAPAVSPTGSVAPLPEADAPFWQRFEDPLLDELVETALRENHDLKAALARFDQANALLRATCRRCCRPRNSR